MNMRSSEKTPFKIEKKEFANLTQELQRKIDKELGPLEPLSNDEKHQYESLALVLYIEDNESFGTASLRYSKKHNLYYAETAAHCLCKWSNYEKKAIIR